MHRIPLLLPALVLALGATAACAEEAEAPKPLAVGERLAAFTATDFAGQTFDSADLAITRERAEGAVRAAAVAFGGAKDAAWDTAVAALSGVQEEGEVSPRRVRLFVAEAGQGFGLQVTEERAAGLRTLKEVVDWILAARDAPILLYSWSPRCGTSRALNGRILEATCAAGLRVFALATNHGDQREHMEGFVDEFDFRTRILLDQEQRLADRLGALRTPHFFLFDAGWVLRYRGGLDDDPAEAQEPQERTNWLTDAAAAVKAGKAVPLAETEPAG